MSDIPGELRSEFYRSLPQSDDTDQISITKLQGLYHLRHDLAHFFCELIMGVKSDFSTIRKLGNMFDFLPDPLSKLSPDIFIERNHVITFVDISVSNNYEFNYNEKFEKYNPVLVFLQDNGYTVNPFYMFWLHPSWNNLQNATMNFKIFLQDHNLPSYPVNEILLDQLTQMHENVSRLIQETRHKVPNELLNFFDRIEQPIPDILSEDELFQAAKSRYPQCEEIINCVEDSSLEEVESLFDGLVEDEDIQNYIKDDKHDHEMYSRAFNSLKLMEESYETCNEKPSFFIPFAPITSTVLDLLSEMDINKNTESNVTLNFKKEQKQVMSMLELIRVSSCNIEFPYASFCKNIEENLLKCFKYPNELSIFNTGMLTGTIEAETVLSRQYSEYKKNNNSTISKRTFFKNMLGQEELRDTLPYIYRNKCIKLPSFPAKLKDFVHKSGTSYKKEHTTREYTRKKTIDQDSFNNMKSFIDLLNTHTDFPSGTHPFLGGSPGCDSPELFNVKSMLLEEHKKFLGMVQQRNCHTMSRHTSLAAAQILHFNELNTSDNTYCCFTNGQPNVLHILRGGSIKRGSDVGQAFFTIFVTDDISWCSKVYGKINVTKMNFNNRHFYLCQTPWVRLTSERLSFMKDQYYSTLSTSYDTWARNKDFSDMEGFFTHMYTFRVCVSMSPSQRVAELLMDTRYIFMSALSTYSNVEKLIVDKFTPPYKNCLEQYIVRQLELKCKQIILYLAANKPKPNRAGFNSKERLNHTLGGEITLPSLWSDYILQDLQSIFDDIFVYVHTSKEPSSEYHEQVKAINTILKYQNEYDSLDNKMKIGLSDKLSLKKWILSGSQVGCSAPVIFQATKLFSTKYSGLFKSFDFKESCLSEPLCNIVSTKACIPEYNRKTVEQEYTKKQFKSIITNINSLTTSGKAEYILNQKKIKKTYCKLDVDMDDDTEIVITTQNRVKVHDALIDWIGRFGMNKNFVIDLFTWNIKHNNCRVLTDTCIKAQYGAKREFYVINLGAKAMARVTENSYKSMAKLCRNEMISIPGDKKLLYIQEALNDAILSSERRKDVLMYVNGDCTKWSACETMASFIAMNQGLKNVFGSTITGYNLVTFCSWANKEIQVPQSILQKLRFISDSTKYLEEGASINSTQNFLQGMFNYSSSIKAVIATEFALHMFKKKYTNEFIHCSHLEHSDDYSLIIRTENLQVFERFRIYHKVSQKLFGINDSIKKTNIQSHIQEFISLFSYNGQLYYPYIKKTKEVGTNLPCSDFRSDVMSITSRVSESIRLGISLESAYFMQRVHCASLADAYSLSPNMKNSIGNVFDIFSRPIEMFGMPDTLPILTVVIKGNPDNYRIYNYGPVKEKRMIESLFLLGQATYDILDLPTATVKEDMGELYNPSFSYPTRHNRIKAIRNKLNMSFEEARNYLELNLTDSLVKPVETNRFHKWLKSMYFNRSFTKAYMRISRSAMTLRHSMFSSKPCILEINCHLKNLGPEVDKEYTTIKKYIADGYNELHLSFKDMTEHEHILLKNNLNCYNSCLDLLYSITRDSILLKREYIVTHTTVNRMPDPFKWISLENTISNLLQFLVNPINFYADRRTFLSETSLQRDIKKLKSYYNLELLKTSSSYCRQVFSEIASQSSNKAFGLTFVNDIPDLPAFIKQFLERGMCYNKTFTMLPTKSITLHNIRTGTPFYIRDWQSNLNTHTGILSQLALIYRCIVLRTTDKVKEANLTKFMGLKIPELQTNVKDFLQNTDLTYLDGIKSGEFARKILCFLKSKLLNDSLDLQNLITSKFHYEVYYYPKRQILKPFKEQADILFLGTKFRSYIFEEGKKSYLFIEMKNLNKSFWFYCYSVAQRVFGLISQSILDERLLETRDFTLPLIPPELRYLLNHIAVRKMEPIFFKKMGKLFRNTTDFNDANLPFVIQDVRITRLLPKTEKLSSAGNIFVSDLTVYIGNIVLFKLPFGSLIHKNYLDNLDDNLNQILIDGIPMKLLIDNDILEKYLKSDYKLIFDDKNFLEVIPSLFENLKESKDMPVKLKNITQLFSLDVLKYNPIREVGTNKIEQINPIDIQNEQIELDLPVSSQFHKDVFKNTFVSKEPQLLMFDFSQFNETIELTSVDEMVTSESSNFQDFLIDDSTFNLNLKVQDNDPLKLNSDNELKPLELIDENIQNSLSKITDVLNKETISSDLYIEKNEFGMQFSESYLMSRLKNLITAESNIETVEVEMDTIDLMGDNYNSTNEGNNARSRSKQYENIVKNRQGLLNNTVNPLTLEDIDFNRNTFVSIMDIEKDELGQLFEHIEYIKQDYESNSSSSGSESENDISWFQLVPSKELIEGVYNFDKRCQEAMVNLNEYILTSLIKPGVEELLNCKNDIVLFLTLLNYLKSGRSSVKLNKKHKGLLKLVLFTITNILKENNRTCYTISRNIGIKWKNDKIELLALKGFETEEEALKISNSKPNISFERDVKNNDSSAYWLSTNLAQQDLDYLFEKGFDSAEFVKRNQLTRLMGELIPRFKKTEFKLKGSYNF